MMNHAPIGGPKILSLARKEDDVFHPVLDSLDNYKMLSE
jgi:hypothetical protein